MILEMQMNAVLLSLFFIFSFLNYKSILFLCQKGFEGFEDVEDAENVKTIIKYEDKYLDEIKNMPNIFVLTPQQEQIKYDKMIDFYNQLKNQYDLHIDTISDALSKNELLLTQYESLLIKYKDPLIVKSSEWDSDYDDELDYEYDKDELEDMIESILSDNQKMYKEKISLENTIDNATLMIKAAEMALQFVHDEHFNKLSNNFVIEKTPVGNVLMFYNNNKKAFEYYSDNTTPYKYLEVVARKYVKMFQCRSLYINMEDEIKLTTTENNNAIDNKNDVKNKKNTFAKFKKYNKLSYNKSVMVDSPSNNISRNIIDKKDKVWLKDNSNHFIYLGKFINFKFLRPIKRELVDKKRVITFNDYKKMNTNF
jgi:hypothetical protein